MIKTVDPIKDWFIKKVVLPRSFVINSPGFITGRYIEIVGIGHFSRHIFLPESFIVDFEKKVYEKKGDEGLRELYKIAKSATWRFSKIMGIPTKSKQPIEKVAPLLFKFLETMYAKEIKTDVNVEKRLLKMKANEMAVYRKNGLGYFLPLGCLSGLWSYVTEDKSIEAEHKDLHNKEHGECVLRAGPKDLLENPIVADEFDTYEEASGYSSMNAPTPIKSLSLEELINNYYFKYNSGLLEMWGERFFPFELGYIFILENQMKKMGLDDVIYDCSFDFYKKFANNLEKKTLTFSDSFMCALGWGKISTFSGDKIKVQIEHYPWCKMFDKNGSFPIISGSLSGLCSGIKNREIKLEAKKSILLDKATLVLEERK